MVETPVPADYRIPRELSALAMLAFATFGTVSLVSVDLGRAPNLGGPVGASIAAALGEIAGYEAYAIMILIAWLAARVWSGAAAGTIAREIGGGAILIVAIATAGALWNLHNLRIGGLLGVKLATALNDSLNVAGGSIAVALAVICGLALMFKRAPTELAAGVTKRIRANSRREVFELTDGDRTRDPISLGPGDEYRNGFDERPTPLKVKLLDLRDIAAARDKRDRAQASKPRQKGAYKIPPQSLLDLPPAEHAQVDQGQLERSARVLEQKLADFGVEGRVVEVQPGPVVTMYKFEPGSGIKVSQIVNLADDLSMALRAAAVRIQAPVPGEAVVGIEVPNRKRERVYLREILEAEEFTAAQSQLTIALGKDIAGRPVAADLAKMPHLLIAGATGTGKSVSIHTMIASILFNATADDVRLILVDPKMLELSVYENIPHLLVPVVVDPQKAASALLWATQEMESRYFRMRELGVRNIDGYNQALASGAPIAQLKLAGQSIPASDDPNQPAVGAIEHRKLPKIVIVIDELADLLLSEGKTVERDITRLAQKARAAGIHLILATQRPSVDVITGLIKANLPARISLQVTSRVDSRTILDSIGAERLLGAGDMLFMPPGSAKLRRLHGPFVGEHEIRKLTDFLREQGAPEYRMEILDTRRPGEDDAAGGGGDFQDQNYDEAVRIVLESDQASISMIQRRLRIGYNRAARMVEQMEREGIVMPADGAKPREVRKRSAN
ncbi:MAG: DNA translocase FtsK 4TM domain-containing protein [Candidatus Binatus sp.]|uniref:FtsK/SpoIIIE family DNA translocase n=1 Tax=Candidatus Binatus sp. TaxID=2811406 RepID=UPI002724B57E|nr:DNA translocase FtsK 4TM domain-containing protein [Candidatus Binatus sp.]MDO8434530.1 DNA translocase FtsK 4TM domain-containing protein [Candidatus Binatus sp.]